MSVYVLMEMPPARLTCTPRIWRSFLLPERKVKPISKYNSAIPLPQCSTFLSPTPLFTPRYSIHFVITGFNGEKSSSLHTILPSTSASCQTIHSSMFADGTSPHILSQGVYSLSITVNDSAHQDIYSTSYPFGLVHPSSLAFECGQLLQQGVTISLPVLQTTPLSLHLPSTFPTQSSSSVRWVLDSSSTFASTISTHEIFGNKQSTSSLSVGKHNLFAFVYPSAYSLPDFSLFLSFEVSGDKQEEKESEPTYAPTVPPRIAPTVPPKSSAETTYCGDGTCNEGEDCLTCPLDCGICNPYSCSQTFCSLPSCQCTHSQHPTITDTQDIPQFVAITWDDAQTPTTFEQVMRVSRQSNVWWNVNMIEKGRYYYYYYYHYHYYIW